jgi:hypothetical protein
LRRWSSFLDSWSVIVFDKLAFFLSLNSGRARLHIRQFKTYTSLA